ncbi:MAG: BatD family protein [Flavobacteriales bacterium]|nr:BatD family protein [Flavobacteriales bacterium]
MTEMICKYKARMKEGMISSFILFLIPSFLFSQNAKVKVSIDTTNIKVGEQAELLLSAEQDDKTVLVWPVIEPNLSKEIEVLKQGTIDTSFSEDKKQILFTQRLTITSFDSGVFTIPPFRFQYLSADDTLSIYTDSLLLYSSTLPVDTLKGFHDISAPLEPPFGWDDFMDYIIILLAVILIAVLIFIYVRKRRKRKPTEPVPVVVQTRPAHEIAIEALNALYIKKLWQKGEVKRYYSELTDIVRRYLNHRYNIDAAEMTTAEILQSVSHIRMNEEPKQQLMQLLNLSDLVKFAKLIPGINEHEMAFSNAKLLVELTALKTDDHADDNA